MQEVGQLIKKKKPPVFVKKKVVNKQLTVFALISIPYAGPIKKVVQNYKKIH
ncbi:MAG: hypothetical protein Q8S18_07445 [Bacteroidales bacterium]|nr:hypothetical protein [Bacteroidales bacterium]